MTPVGTAPNGDVSISDVIGMFQAYTRVLWSGRRRLIRPVVIALIIGLVVALGSREEFSASMKVLPYKSGALNSNSLSGLAGLAGLRLPSGLSDQTITSDLYPVIAKTLDYEVSLAETPVRFSLTGEPMTPAKYFETHRTMIDAVTDAVSDARAAVTALLTGGKPVVPAVFTGANGAPLAAYSKKYLRLVTTVGDRLTVTMDRKTSVISINALMPTPYAAADLAQIASQTLMRRIIDYEAKKAGEQLAFVEQQYEQSRARYEKAQRNLAEFADRNRQLTGAIALVEKDRLQREFDIEFQVYQQLSNELQQARIKKSQDTPVFTILEQAIVPATRTSPKRTGLVIMSLLVGLGYGLARILYEHFRASQT